MFYEILILIKIILIFVHEMSSQWLKVDFVTSSDIF